MVDLRLETYEMGPLETSRSDFYATLNEWKRSNILADELTEAILKHEAAAAADAEARIEAIVVAEGEEAERLAAGQAAKAVDLRAALLNLMGDNHHYSTRPCSTCSQCRKALGIEIDKATMAGMLGCGFSTVENLAAWRLATADA